MYNVRHFLEGGHFVSQADAKAEGRSKENSLFFERKNGNRKIRFQVVDNPTRLSSADWDRVVAVFVQGNTWQFKGWKWDTPAELFHHVMGFVLDFDEKGQDPKMSGWNVTRLTISRSRRHLDSNAIFQFWSKFEDYLKSRRML
jgi:parafibromin